MFIHPTKFILILMVFVFVISAIGQDCTVPDDAKSKFEDPADYYLSLKYKVRDVRVSAPLGWLFPSVDKDIKALAAGNPYVKAQDEFDPNRAANAYIWVKEALPPLEVDKQTRIAVRFGGNTIENCHDGELDVVLKFFVFNPSIYYGRTFEFGGTDDLKRTTVKTKSTEGLSRFSVQPYVSYNSTRRIYAGTKFSAKINNLVVREFDLNVSGSPNSFRVTASGEGVKDFKKGFINHAEWRAGYDFSRIPTDFGKLKSGSGFGQFYLASRSIGKNDLIFRFGGAIEGGNRQAENFAGVLGINELKDSRILSAKGFAGVSAKFGLHAFKASYGIQLGSANKGSKIDFVKQIFDFAGSLNFSKFRDLSIESQFTAGNIYNRGKLPVVEKFFGGNKEQFFIAESNWQIRSNPFITSFAENKLAFINNSNIPGFDRFASFNLTISAVVWKEPLVERSLWEDPNNPGEYKPCEKKDKTCFKNVIDGEFRAGQSEMASSFILETPEFEAILGTVKEMEKPLLVLQKILKNLPSDSSAINAIKDELFKTPACDDCRATGKFDKVIATVNATIKDSEDDKADPSVIKAFIVDDKFVDDDTGEVEIDLSPFNALMEQLVKLEELLPATTPNNIKTNRENLIPLGKKLASQYDDFNKPRKDSNGNVLPSINEEANKQAEKDIEYPKSVFDFIIRKADMYSIRPLFIFDATYVQQGGLISGRRLGVGGGVKFTFLGMGLTGGYVWNPNPRFREKSGAFLFSFEINDLFK